MQYTMWQATIQNDMNVMLTLLLDLGVIGYVFLYTCEVHMIAATTILGIG